MFGKMTKVISLLVVFALLTGAMVGCGGSKNVGNAAKPAETKKTAEEKKEPIKVEEATVTFMTWESQTMNQMILNSFKDFEKENPGIKVSLVPSPLKDYGTKLKQMISAKQAPDIFMVGNDWALQYGAQGQLFDWTEHATKESGLLDNYYPGVIENWKVNGKIYGLPGLLNCYGVFYNKRMFREANIPEPKNGWTYKEMLEAARKLSGMKDGVQRYGLYYPPYTAFDPFFLSVYAVSAGGTPFADSIVNVTRVEAGPEFKEGVNLIIQGIKDGSIAPPTFNADNLVTMFMQEKIPMMQHGQWNADELIRNAPKNLEWGFVANPIVSSQSTIYDCVGWASHASIKNPDAVWKVLKYIDTKAYEVVLPQTPVAPPAYVKSAAPYYSKLKETGHEDVAEALDYMLKSPNKQPIRFQQSWAGEAKKFIDADWNKILMGQVPVSKIDEIVKNINDVIAKNK